MVFDLKAWWHFVSEAIPIGISAVIRKVSWQVDILILVAIGSATSVGLFSAPYRIVQSIHMLSQSLSIPFFPHFSRLAKSSCQELLKMFQKSLKFMYLVSVPFVVILFTLSRSIVFIVFGPEFGDSYIALKIMSFVVFFLFLQLNFHIYLLLSVNRGYLL